MTNKCSKMNKENVMKKKYRTEDGTEDYRLYFVVGKRPERRIEC